MSKTVALVDDDRNLLTSLSMALRKEGFDVDVYTDGESAFRGLNNKLPDIMVLDIKMPRLDGEELLKKIRKKSNVPVIFLTSKDKEVDELVGLKLGADDYVKKSGSWSHDVLVERIKALLRRSDGSMDNNLENKVIIRGSLKLDLSKKECLWKEKALPERLTSTEFQIVFELVNHIGVVKSRNQLMDKAYKEDIYVDDRTIDSHVKRIRRKFRSLDENFDAIETLYGTGYCWNDKKK